MNESILSNIRAEYDKKRKAAKDDLEKRKKRIYLMFPRVEEIDQQIALTTIKLSKIILMNPDNVNEEIEKLKNEVNNLKQEKEKIFIDNRIPKNYLQIKYKCSLCEDTGYMKNGDRCKCYKQNIIEHLYNMSNIKQMLEKENFNEFNINVFSNDRYKDEPVTPRQNMYTILDICQDFCSNFEKNKSILFYGGTGLGKTFLCNCIANELIQKGKTVVYQTAANLMEIVENHRFNKNDETQLNKENYKFLYESDLLIIDDVGTEFINSFTNSELFNIINTRMTSNKKMVISTNLTLDQLATTYSDRIISRIFNEFTICYFYGKDLRWENR